MRAKRRERVKRMAMTMPAVAAVERGMAMVGCCIVREVAGVECVEG
jgi:hypothetical protein